MSLIDEKKSGGRSSLWTVPLNSYLILLYYVFVVAGFLVRGDDQQPEQERGARHGLEHGRSAQERQATTKVIKKRNLLYILAHSTGTQPWF